VASERKTAAIVRPVSPASKIVLEGGTRPAGNVVGKVLVRGIAGSGAEVTTGAGARELKVTEKDDGALLVVRTVTVVKVAGTAPKRITSPSSRL
jgi:hypothetical protein